MRNKKLYVWGINGTKQYTTISPLGDVMEGREGVADEMEAMFKRLINKEIRNSTKKIRDIKMVIETEKHGRMEIDFEEAM